MRNKLGSNIIYQTIYQVLAVITPLITAPYISRILGAEGLGLFSFSLTNATYFTLFAMLGVANYGCRSIANVQEDKTKRSIVFWNIYSIQVFCSLIMLICYGVFVIRFVTTNTELYVIQTTIVLSCVFDVNWYFFGVEKFRITVTRNIIIKVITVICVLTCVNSNTGVIGYALIMGIGTLLSNLVLIPFLKEEIVFIKPSISEIKKHIRPNIVLFIPVLATSVFHVMDKTMLGTLGSITQLGYYTNSDKVVNIPIGIINGLGLVYLPRITAMRQDSHDEEMISVVRSSLELYSFTIMALALGLAAISKEFAPMFFGPGYDPCADLIIMFVPVFIVKSYSVYVRMNILIPYEKEKRYTLAVCIGAIVNFLVNIVLIPKYGAYGAVVGTFFAELIVCVIQAYHLPVSIDIKSTLSAIVPYAGSGLIMVIAIRFIAKISIDLIPLVIVEVFVGMIVYLICCVIYWRIFYKKNILSDIFLILKKRN